MNFQKRALELAGEKIDALARLDKAELTLEYVMDAVRAGRPHDQIIKVYETVQAVPL